MRAKEFTINQGRCAAAQVYFSISVFAAILQLYIDSNSLK